MFNLRPSGVQITLLLTFKKISFKIFGCARTQGKKCLKLCQTSFSGMIDSGLFSYCYTRGCFSSFWGEGDRGNMWLPYQGDTL